MNFSLATFRCCTACAHPSSPITEHRQLLHKSGRYRRGHPSSPGSDVWTDGWQSGTTPVVLYLRSQEKRHARGNRDRVEGGEGSANANFKKHETIACDPSIFSRNVSIFLHVLLDMFVPAVNLARPACQRAWLRPADLRRILLFFCNRSSREKERRSPPSFRFSELWRQV